MPVVNIKLLEGRSIQQKEQAIKKVTQAVCESFDVKPENVTIFIEDFKRGNLGKNGKVV